MEPTTDNKRLFIAVAVSMAILLVWQIFLVDPPPPPEEEATEEVAEEGEAAEGETDQEKGDAAKEAERPDEAAPSLVAPEVEIPPQEVLLSTQHYDLTLTNIGGRALHYHVTDPSRFGARGDLFGALVDRAEEGQVPEDLPFGTTFETLELSPKSAFEVIEAPEGVVAFRWVSPDGKASVEKRFSKGAAEFEVKMEVEVRNQGSEPLSDAILFEIVGEQTGPPSMLSPDQPLTTRCLAEDSVEYSDDEDKETYTKDIEWIAIDEAYFAMVAKRDGEMSECQVLGSTDDLVWANLTAPFEVAPGEAETLTFLIFVGPKESQYLTAFGHGAERAIDYGWVEFIARPISWVLGFLYGLVNNWGLAIIILTILIRGGLWPITQKSQESMMRMKDVSPQLKELQAKYKNDPALMQQKQMELFKEHNVSPFGCLPMFLQIPIWFALYRTIYVNAGLYHASFAGWLTDLSAPDPYYILPVVAGALFFLQQKLSPNTITDPKQKVMMTIFPLVFVVVMLFLPSGLNLYMLVSSMIGIAQVVYTAKKQERQKAEAAKNAAKPTSKAKRNKKQRSGA